ncbi:Rab family, other [Trypanosoma rangeli]|uniref:Ras-related protein Rab-21 n=1 Tax=Trypanosoma rangeli TaxID=5698 RepID=A0A422N7J5_TRYRA|nr:Rab family, other [Trypanosoma rangeli]RNF01440.1 Rab family, other [Trypanosoma rangeli]|eukprot:RNF01440.1 Rab family, other [Trypanosoma rangeli]
MLPGHKVILLGEGRVGKTSLVSRFVQDTFDENQSSTIQASMHMSADVPLLDGSGATVNLNVWDTAGQERFHALGPIYYRNADGALLVYDITDADTLEKVRLWIRELRAVVGSRIQLVICGNKSDLEEDRDIARETAVAFAKAQGALHFDTSAKTGDNVAEAFQALATAIATASGGRGSGSGATSAGTANNPGSVTAAADRRRRRGLLRIEELQDEPVDSRGQAPTAGRGDANASPVVRGAAVALASADYTYTDTRRAREQGPATVSLRAATAPITGQPSGSGGTRGCCT